ncbi:unnamed protein product [Caenorhabditis sp. 36 PRJEB53466]|nr:unnamed protein product [Caenorhabditis sp. 36 PRJEB53466]
MDFEDDYYYWSKNQGPSEEKNHERNSSAEHYLANLKDKCGIVKTYHMHSENNQWTNEYRRKMDTLMGHDLRPFVLFSMNKRRNWEIEESIGVRLMAEIQNLHKGEDVMFLERVAVGSTFWSNCFRFNFHWKHFRISAVHELNTYVSGRPAYKKTSVNSIYGQYLQNLEEHNRCSCKEDAEIIKAERVRNAEKEERILVAYHLMKPPENYFSLMHKKFVRMHIYSGRWKAAAYWERVRRKSLCYLDIRYDDYEEEEFEGEDEDDHGVDFEQKQRDRCYNFLDDHFVDDFVHVKRKKKKKKKDK